MCRLRSLQKRVYGKNSFSRKYRSEKISDVIGQDFAVKTIKIRSIEKIAHAFFTD